MARLGRWTLLLMIPLNLLLIWWLIVGRDRLLSGPGWLTFVFFFTVIPVVFIALALSSVLALTQPGWTLTPLQTRAQWATWVGLLGFATCCPDQYGLRGDRYDALLMRVLDDHSDQAVALSFAVTGLFATMAVAGYIILIAALTVAGRIRKAVPTPVG